MVIKLNCLGPLQLEHPANAQPTGQFNQKTRAILAYLAVTNESHSRQKLYEWFCQNARDPAGTLRWHLSQIRKQTLPELLDVTRKSVAINEAFFVADYRDLETAVHLEANLSIDELSKAVSGYRGPFLADLIIKNAPEFDLWLLRQRSYWQRIFEQAALLLLRKQVEIKAYGEALKTAQKILQHNPLLETVHIYSVWLYAQMGQKSSALEQVAQCRALLWEELAVEPTNELVALEIAIQNNSEIPSLFPETEPQTQEKVESDVPFIGRDEPLRQLESVWQSGGHVVLVAGAAGSGKTNLVQTFQSRIGEVATFNGRCYETTQSLLYHPWQSILEQKISQIGDVGLQQVPLYWRQLLSHLLPELGETAVSPNQQQLFRAVAHLLIEYAEIPTIFFIDDLQWADEASFQLFQFIAQQIEQTKQNVLLIATVRSEEVSGNAQLETLLSDLARLPNYLSIQIDPFDEAETEKLITQLAPQITDPNEIASMGRHLRMATEGNPLYMSEILQELVLVPSKSSELPLPPSLSALIAKRLTQLPENGRQIIESLAILDQPSSFDLVQTISGRSEEETITAVERGLHWRLLKLQDTQQLDFSHNLMRTAVLQQISPIRQQRLHFRVAQTLENEQAEAATLAYHWGQAGNHTKGSHFALIAGEKATRLYAIDEAIRLYQSVVAHSPEQENQLRAMIQLARLYQRISDWESSEKMLTDGLKLAHPGRENYNRLQILLAQLQMRQSQYQTALDILKETYASCLALGDKAILAQCVGSMGIVYYFQDALDDCLACYEEALQLSQELNDEENEAVWLSNVAIVHTYRNENETALRYQEQVLIVQKRLGNQEQTAVTLGNVGNSYGQLGQFEKAITYHKEALFIRNEWGDKAGVGTHLRDMGVDYAEAGFEQSAFDCFWQALTLDVELGRRDACGISLFHLSALMRKQSDFANAKRMIVLAVELLRAASSRLFLCRSLLSLIEQLWDDGAFEQIEKLLEEATQVASEIEAPHEALACQLTAVQLQVAQNQISSAEAVTKLQTISPIDDVQRADIGIAIWQIDPQQEAIRQKTVEQIESLLSVNGKEKFRHQYQTLTGQIADLSFSTLPDPVYIVDPLGKTIESYLAQLQILIPK